MVVKERQRLGKGVPSDWYPIACRIHHASDKDYKEPTEEQIKEPYQRYTLGRCDYY